MDKEILKILLREVVKKFPNTGSEYDFDAHDVIRKFMGDFPDCYELLLAEQKDMDTEHAIQQVHSIIGRTLTGLGDVIKFMGKQSSINYKGEQSQNSIWKKL